MRRLRLATTALLALIAIAAAVRLGLRAQNWNDELAIRSTLIDPSSPPLDDAAHVAPPLAIDPHTPRLSRTVLLVIVDGLGADESHLPFLDELRARGVAAVARVPYPTISRPNYVTLLTGVPPADSGVRANRVRAPVEVDTAMDRVRAAGLRVAAASDAGPLASLFVRHASGVPAGGAGEWRDDGERIAPRPPMTWPVDEARHGELADLARILPALARAGAAFVPVLVIDVDRAGHASGVGAEYRAAAADVDRMLRAAVGGLDLTRDTVIITADHGHVAPGGHGGVEPEVSHVPLVIAGAGVVPGATAPDARSIDVAPTVAALLGVPAPAHAEGRALVELLALSPDAAARRAAVDRVRGEALALIADAARSQIARPSLAMLALVALGLAIAVVAGTLLARRGAIAVPRAAALGALAVPLMLVALGAMTRWRFSPSYVPSLPRVMHVLAIAAIASVLAQLAASWLVLRRAPRADRLAAANGVALVALTLSLVAVGLARAWYAPPFLDVPPPFWFVALPALDLGVATSALATALMLTVATLLPRAQPPPQKC